MGRENRYTEFPCIREYPTLNDQLVLPVFGCALQSSVYSVKIQSQDSATGHSGLTAPAPVYLETPQSILILLGLNHYVRQHPSIRVAVDAQGGGVTYSKSPSESTTVIPTHTSILSIENPMLSLVLSLHREPR